MHLHRRIAVAAIAALLVLSGCTGPRAEAEPTPSRAPTTGTETAGPTPSAAPSPTPSEPAIAPPEPPADLARTDEAGAAAAATHFLQLYSYILKSGDFTEWEARSLPQCTFCTSTRDYVRNTLSNGGSFEGGQVVANVVVVHPLDELVGGYPVDVDVMQEATIERDSDGIVVAATPDEALQSQVDVVLTADGWRILEVSNRTNPS